MGVVHSKHQQTPQHSHYRKPLLDSQFFEATSRKGAVLLVQPLSGETLQPKSLYPVTPG
jgi:hypothetical protein